MILADEMDADGPTSCELAPAGTFSKDPLYGITDGGGRVRWRIRSTYREVGEDACDAGAAAAVN